SSGLRDLNVFPARRSSELVPLRDVRQAALEVERDRRTRRIVRGGLQLAAAGDLLLQLREFRLAVENAVDAGLVKHPGLYAHVYLRTAPSSVWKISSATAMACAAAW